MTKQWSNFRKSCFKQKKEDNIMKNSYEFTSAVNKAKECLDILLYMEPAQLELAQKIINMGIAASMKQEKENDNAAI